MLRHFPWGGSRNGLAEGGLGVEPELPEIFPGTAPGFLFSFASVAQEVLPNLASFLQEQMRWAQEGARAGMPPLLENPDDLFKARFALRAPPTFRAGLGVPEEEQGGATSARPDFTLHPAGVLGFGLIEAQDGLDLAKDEFDLPAQAIEVTHHRGGE